jgi:uncharacterized damage-inducible protein DinB
MRNGKERRDVEDLLESWDQNNVILLNLLHAVSDGGLDATAMEGSLSVGEMFTHINCVRLAAVQEGVPESAGNRTAQESAEHEPVRIEEMLNDSARAVREAVRTRLEASGDSVQRDHTIRRFEYMVLHERYHYNQMKLALKLAGRPIPDEEAEPVRAA